MTAKPLSATTTSWRLGNHTGTTQCRPTNLQDHLQSPLSKFLVHARFVLIISLGRRQYSEKGQSPNTTCPRNRCQQHKTQPTQTTGLDKVTVTGSNRISIDSLGFDLRSPPPFKGGSVFRTIVSSNPIMMGPHKAKALTKRLNKIWLASRLDHFARFRTR